jgi:hypothetical protein
MTAVSIRDAGQILVKGRTQIYGMLATGKLVAVKDGKRTLVTVESIKAHQDTLQPATIRPLKPRTESLAKLKLARERAEARRKRRRS